METCCICLEPYEQQQPAKGLKSRLCSQTCSHGICLQCAITHIVAYDNEFCPYCRMDQAFSEDNLASFVGTHDAGPAEVLMRNAKFEAVKEKLAVPWICDTMTTLLQGEANTDDYLPSAKLTSSFHVETRSVDRRANGEIFAEFCLSLIKNGEGEPVSETSCADECRVLLECTIQPLPNNDSSDSPEDEEEMA